jgi:hypothetical protein
MVVIYKSLARSDGPVFEFQKCGEACSAALHCTGHNIFFFISTHKISLGCGASILVFCESNKISAIIPSQVQDALQLSAVGFYQLQYMCANYWITFILSRAEGIDGSLFFPLSFADSFLDFTYFLIMLLPSEQLPDSLRTI